MDGLDLSTTNFGPDGESSSDAILPIGSTRKASVTFDTRTTLDSNVVLSGISSFLKEKVFPVVSDHCEINLHWDGLDLSTLHVRSIVPDNYVLLPRTTASNGGVPSRVSNSSVFDRDPPSRPSPPPNITIKEEPIDVSDDLIVVHDHEIKQEVVVDSQDDVSSDEGKYSSNERLVADPLDEVNAVGAGGSINDKQFCSNLRPEPLAPAGPHPPPPPYSMYFPQNSMIPMVPLMAFGQSQLSYPQVAPVLFSPMQSLPQMPLHGMIPQMVPGYSPFLQSPYNIQPVPFPQFSQSLQSDISPTSSVLFQRSSRFM